MYANSYCAFHIIEENFFFLNERSNGLQLNGLLWYWNWQQAKFKIHFVNNNKLIEMIFGIYIHNCEQQQKMSSKNFWNKSTTVEFKVSISID